mmetsp:Transcript_142058/g.345082  ORF Transcript_142058/g.345082 Transcript_142058/m.345082 type:complete len:413 (-) Transcript_142058:60-1298(-)
MALAHVRYAFERVLFVCVAWCWRTSSAWSVQGHLRVAEVAQLVMKERPLQKIGRMLHGSLVDFANWEQNMTTKHPETDALHWHRQNPEWTCGVLSGKQSKTDNVDQYKAPNFDESKGLQGGIIQHVSDMIVRRLGDKSGHIRCDDHAAESGSLFCALAYFFEQFAHDALLREFPKPKEPIGTPTKLLALAKFKHNELKPYHYLRWLAILIGDLHQPIHWLREYNYGRDIKVMFRGNEHTLFSIWEELIPQNLAAPMPSKLLVKQYEQQAPAWWDKMPPELFREWAKEMAQVVCQQVYTPMEVNGTDGTSAIETPFKLEEDLFGKWVQLGRDFTTLGGVRLAYVLNEILEHKKHKTAHKEGRGRHHRHRNWSRSLAINAGITAVVAPLLLLAFRLHLNGGGVSLRSFVAHLKN